MKKQLQKEQLNKASGGGKIIITRRITKRCDAITRMHAVPDGYIVRVKLVDSKPLKKPYKTGKE